MALRWLRGVSPKTLTGGGYEGAAYHGAYTLFVYYFLRYVMGYQHLDEVVNGGPTRTFANCHEATGSDGAFAGSTVTFTSASNPFTIADVGKFLVMLDPTNPENCGIHPITVFNGTGSVDIDFFSSAFPTSASGITWYLLDDGSQGSGSIPNTLGDYAVLRANHASYPWEIKLTLKDGTVGPNVGGAQVEVAAESGAWNAVGNTWNTGVALLTERCFQGKYYQDINSRMYMVADTEASFVFYFCDMVGRGTKVATQISLITPNETRGARERLTISGKYPGDNTSSNDTGKSDDSDLGYVNVWSEKGNKEVLAWWQGWMPEGSSQDWFLQDMGVNVRTGERDSFPIWLTIDPIVSADYLFGPLGEIPTNRMRLATANIVGEYATFDSDQWMHWKQGLVVPWNGLNQS